MHHRGRGVLLEGRRLSDAMAVVHQLQLWVMLGEGRPGLPWSVANIFSRHQTSRKHQSCPCFFSQYGVCRFFIFLDPKVYLPLLSSINEHRRPMSRWPLPHLSDVTRSASIYWKGRMAVSVVIACHYSCIFDVYLSLGSLAGHSRNHTALAFLPRSSRPRPAYSFWGSSSNSAVRSALALSRVSLTR